MVKHREEGEVFMLSTSVSRGRCGLASPGKKGEVCPGVHEEGTVQVSSPGPVGSGSQTPRKVRSKHTRKGKGDGGDFTECWIALAAIVANDQRIVLIILLQELLWGIVRVNVDLRECIVDSLLLIASS